MKYIATFYSHFGAIRFKREAPEGNQYRTPSSAARFEFLFGTSASFDASDSFTFTEDPTEEIEQIVAVTEGGYKLYMKVQINNFEIQILHCI